MPAATMYSRGKVLTEEETMAKLHSDALSDLSDLELSDSGKMTIIYQPPVQVKIYNLVI